MTLHTDATHDPSLHSWVASANNVNSVNSVNSVSSVSSVSSANSADTDFPLQNLPYGRFRRAGSAEPWRIGIAIGEHILDLAAARGCSGWPAALASPLEPRRRCPSNSTRRLAADRRDARAR